MDRFSERLASGPPIVGDGGMGTLVSSAVARLRCPEEANLRAPESVLSLHLGFIRAGAELIETNTFGANRHKLRTHFLEDEVKAINEAGVKIARDAREVSGRDVFIAGSIGPLGEIGARRDDREELFTEQAELLEGRGVDLFLVETFYELDELETAIRAVRSVSSLPIVALLTFDEDAHTLGGVSAARAAAALEEQDVAAIGANHGLGLQAALRALEQMSASGKPLAALPNVGLASLAGPACRLPARDARVLRGLRRARAGARGTDHRRLLRHDTDADRGGPGRRRPGPAPERAAGRAGARARDRVFASPSTRRCSSRSSAPASSSSPSRSTRRAGGRRRRCSTSPGR